MPQLVMLCWAHLQCFAGRTGRTHGTTVAGKHAQYLQNQAFSKKFKASDTRAFSLLPGLCVPEKIEIENW